MKRTFVVLNLIVVLAMLLSACATQAPAPAAPAAAPQANEAPKAAPQATEAPKAAPTAAVKAAGPINVAFSIPGLQFPFFVFMETQVKDEAKKLGMNVATLDGQNQVP